MAPNATFRAGSQTPCASPVASHPASLTKSPTTRELFGRGIKRQNSFDFCFDFPRTALKDISTLWSYTRAIAELSPTMFEGYPRYAPGAHAAPVVTETTTELSEMPAIAGPQDLRAMITRLRLVQEDPRQLLSGCIADYAAE
jgi:hypothetical protein